MKIRKINILLACTFGAMIAFVGCKKDDGAIPSRVTVTAVPTITTNLDPTGSQAIDLLNLSTFAGKFKVDLYFAGAVPPTKVDVVVRKNGLASNVKLFKAAVTTLPAIITVTAADITTLFGTAIALGDTYDFAPDIYLGDRKFEAFPLTGVGSGAGPIAQPLYGEYARFAAICAYDPLIYQGDFTVVSDAWADFSPGDIITLTKVDATHFSFVDKWAIGAPAPVPIVVAVNTANNQVSIPKTVIGALWNYGSPTYSNPAVSATASTSSIVTPCSKQVSIAMTYYWGTGSATSQGPYALVLKKP